MFSSSLLLLFVMWRNFNLSVKQIHVDKLEEETRGKWRNERENKKHWRTFWEFNICELFKWFPIPAWKRETISDSGYKFMWKWSCMEQEDTLKTSVVSNKISFMLWLWNHFLFKLCCNCSNRLRSFMSIPEPRICSHFLISSNKSGISSLKSFGLNLAAFVINLLRK